MVRSERCKRADNKTNPAVERVQLEAQDAHVASLEGELMKAECAGRVQHHWVRELHGNVCVYARLQLLLKSNAAVNNAVVLHEHSKVLVLR